MDDAARYNAQRWSALVAADALFTRPWLDLDPETALAGVDPDGRFGGVRGKQVLCLASGGGQQSAAFALAGAHVAVVDLSAGQIERDREAAQHYGLDVEAVQGDMRDLSRFPADRFDLVYHPYSINFVPDCDMVFAEVARVLRPGGIYEFGAANPFAAGLGTHSWNGQAYELTGRYDQGGLVTYPDESWVFPDPAKAPLVEPVIEYRHLLSTLINGLAHNGLVIRHLREEAADWTEQEQTPGTWAHFTRTIPPWLTFLAEKVSGPNRA